LAAHFVELTTFRSENDQHKVHNHGICTRGLNHEDDIIWMYVIIGHEGTNSNGHGEGEEESMNLVETIKFL
jgi:hypothetical protein